MDYVVGSVAALISGNVTPNRPKLKKRALTPTKYQASPNVTPKSEFVEDRSIFLSPTLQKKKAIVKKSPKRIFQNPDLENTNGSDGNSSLNSPKAEKVKKHLKNELDCESTANKMVVSQTPCKSKLNNSQESVSSQETSFNTSAQSSNENTPKKKKKKRNSLSQVEGNEITEQADTVDHQHKETQAQASTQGKNNKKSPKKMMQRRKSVMEDNDADENGISSIIKSTSKANNTEVTKQDNIADNQDKVAETGNTQNKKNKNKKRKKKGQQNKITMDTIKDKTDIKETTEEVNKDNVLATNTVQKKKNKKRKKKGKPLTNNITIDSKEDTKNTDKEAIQKINDEAKKKPKPPKKTDLEVNQALETDAGEESDIDMEESTESGEINPNAITNQDSDSEHDSDDEIESENEEINKSVLELPPPEESSDEEEAKPEKPEKVEKKPKETVERNTKDEIKRTVFVGNVPFSPKCKKEIKKIFGKHGQIETIRIRTVPIKDGRFTPKLALIKNELHPERSTVNVYIKYAEASSVEQALTENNTLLNEHHLRVSRSDSTGSEHDPRCSIFVGNLPFALEDDALRGKFESCGEIKSVRIIRDKKTNAGKGFGYVNFLSKDGVELALALSEEDLTIKNRILRVKRCTQITNKQKATGSNQVQQKGFRPQGNQGKPRQEGFQRNNRFQGQRNDRFQAQGNSFQERGNDRMANRGGSQGQGRFQRPEGGNQGRFQRQGAGNQGKFQGQEQKENEGAFRRILNKRQNQDGGDGPPNKRQKNITQPNKEKKVRKEFVGMTAEKKKKRKFDKGQKKKKALSEILTK